MRKQLILLLCFFPFLAAGQQDFKVAIIDEQTGKAMGQLYCTILKNNDRFVTCGTSGEDGVYQFHMNDYDSTATYQIEILNRMKNYVESGRHDISTISRTVPIVKVKPKQSVMPYTCSSPSYSGYVPKEPYSIDELPPEIKEKVKTHLINRVGTRFYQRLRLNGGQILDLERFYAVNPGAKAKGYVPDTYNLCFMVSAPDDPRGLYSFSLKLNKQGDLTEQIQIPDIRNNQQKSIIISETEAIKIAGQYNFYNENTTPAITYNQDEGSILWEFERLTFTRGSYPVSNVLQIDAHTGKVIKVHEKNIIIVE